MNTLSHHIQTEQIRSRASLLGSDLSSRARHESRRRRVAASPSSLADLGCAKLTLPSCQSPAQAALVSLRSDASARGGVARRIRCQHQSRQETGRAYHPQVKERGHLGQPASFREAVAAADGGPLQASSGTCPSRAPSLPRDKLREVPLWLGSRPVSADIGEADARRTMSCASPARLLYAQQAHMTSAQSKRSPRAESSPTESNTVQ